jgi:hypothetical protein
MECGGKVFENDNPIPWFLSLLLPANIKLAFVKMGFISLLLEIIFYSEKSICERVFGVFDGLPVEEPLVGFSGVWRHLAEERSVVVEWAMARGWPFS